MKTLFAIATMLTVPTAAAWEDFPVVKSLEEAKALPSDTTAVTVNSRKETRAILEELATRDQIYSLNIDLHSADNAGPLKDFERLYSLSIYTRARPAVLFPALGELKDLRSLHFKVY